MRVPSASPGAVHAMALVASARAAVAAARAVADRRAGRDASAQEPPTDAARDLAALAAEAHSLALQLRLRAAVGPPDDPAAAVAHAFETRLLVADLARALRVAHQKLLSLYPAAPAEAAETARQLVAEATLALGSDAPDLAGLAARVTDAADALAGR